MRTPTAELGKNDFLKLMIGQLQNQDPLSPTDNSQQMAQLPSTRRSSRCRTSPRRSRPIRAYSMIGRDVTYTDKATGAVTTGKVEKVVLENGKATLTVNGTAGILPGAVTEVK
jgi:flagellar basal-body rod modification protein FlgD